MHETIDDIHRYIITVAPCISITEISADIEYLFEYSCNSLIGYTRSRVSLYIHMHNQIEYSLNMLIIVIIDYNYT